MEYLLLALLIGALYILLPWIIKPVVERILNEIVSETWTLTNSIENTITAYVRGKRVRYVYLWLKQQHGEKEFEIGIEEDHKDFQVARSLGSGDQVNFERVPGILPELKDFLTLARHLRLKVER